MRQQHEVENARVAVANIEAQLHRAGNCSPEMKAWFMGARCGLAFALGLPGSGRKLEQFILQMQTGLPVGVVINPFEGSKMLDAMRNPEEEKP